MSDLNDLSTFAGRLKQFYFRYKIIILPVSVLLIPCLVGFGAAFAYNGDSFATNGSTVASVSATPIPILKAIVPILYSSKTKGNPSHSQLEILGDGNRPTYDVPDKTTYYQFFDKFPGFNGSTFQHQNLSKIVSLTIMWFHLDGPTLSEELGEYFPNLEKLRLDNITMTGFLQLTNLPKLEDFYFDQILDGSQDGKPDYAFFKEIDTDEAVPPLDALVPKFLESVFFYTNSHDPFYMQLLRNQIKLSIWQSGSVVFVEDPADHVIRINLPKCHPKIVNSTYEKITLGFCFDLDSSSIPSTAKYLNIYLSKNFNKELYDALLPRLVNLEELYFELPGTQLDLASLPPSLKILSVSSIELVSTTAIVPSVKEFYFGGMNEYKFVDSMQTDLKLQNFSYHFPNIEKVGLFDVVENRYNLLKDVLDTTAKLISVHNFQRMENEGEFGEFLSQIGINPNETNFLIEKSGLIVKGRSIDPLEQVELRFKNLGWDTVDLWNKYVHVNRLIEHGFVLGKRPS